MKVLGIDQSLSKCAFCFMVDGKPTRLELSKTGASKVKNKRPDTNYYDCLHDQIHQVCVDLEGYVNTFQPDHITFESLSFGSAGNATRNLACLFGAMREALLVNFSHIPVHEYAPTALKSYARDFLKPDRQHEGVLTSGKPKKAKMDKKMMVESVKNKFGDDYLKGYNYSSGLDDLADATWLAHKTWVSHGKET